MEPGIDGTASLHRPYVSSDEAHGGTRRALTPALTPAQRSAPTPGLAFQRPGETIGRSGWPLRTHMELGALASAVPCARLHACHVLWEWQQRDLIETAGLIVSELMTNAITATQAIKSDHPVRLWLLSDRSRTLIAVGDPSHYPPRLIDAPVEEAGGRGLMLVQALSSNWGWYATHKPRTAKVVWAELRVPPEGGTPENASGDE